VQSTGASAFGRPVHPTIVTLSAESYLTQLRGATLSPNGLVALKSLEESVAACAAWGSEVLTEAVTFSWDVMSRVPLQDADGFTNHYQLGCGRDDAPVISVGTEHAYQLLVRNPDGTYRDVGLREITIESACALYWLTGSRPDVTLKLNDCPEWNWRRPFSSTWPYHIYTAEYHRVSGGGTWATIGRGVLQAGDTWRRALGNRCYQIELSAYPASQAARGRPPTEERVRFLTEVLSTLRNTARVAIFHGTPKFTERDPRLELAEVFLGVATLPSATVRSHEHEEGLRIYDGGDRRVIFARALNRRNRYVSAEYLASIARLIADVVPAAVGP
jgi:hypothetical protein